METIKDMNDWRAEKLGYVYFSRLTDLIIKESSGKDELFDYWIDISENHQPTGRYFVVEVKSVDQFDKNSKLDNLFKNSYSNVTMPALLVLFDNNNDHGYYIWIKKPEKNGQLVLDGSKAEIAELTNESLHTIVTEIKDWYSNRQIA
jgi:hypothetical protein